MNQGERFRAARIARGLSQMAAARESGVDISTISKIERGLHANPGTQTTVALAAVYGVSTDSLITDGHGPTDRQELADGPQSPKEATNAE